MKKMIFFIRHFNDFDHITPVIWSLLKTKKVKVYLILTDPFNEKFYKQNFRTKEIEKLGAKIIGFSDSNIRFKYLFPLVGALYNFNKNFFKLNLITSKIGGVLVKFFFKKDFQENYLDNLIKDLVINKDCKILVFDHMVDPIRKKIIYIAKENKCKTISLPHGLVMYSYKKKWLNEYKKKNVKALKIFDKVVFPNNLRNFYNIEKKILKKKFTYLGSPRFSEPWISFINKNLKKNFEKSKKKIKILFLVEKELNYLNKKKHVVVDFLKQLEILNFLKSQPNLSLEIKMNTRGISQKQSILLKNKFKSNISHEETSSLIFSSDVVISGGASSAILQSICMKVPTICCTYLHPEHSLYYKKFDFPIEIKSFQELKKLFEKKEIFKKQNNEKNRLNFLNKITLYKQNPSNLHNQFFLKI